MNSPEKLIQDYELLIEQAHTVLSVGGVPDATGRPCDDKSCQSKLVHRLHELLNERDKIKLQNEQYLGQIREQAKTIEATIGQREAFKGNYHRVLERDAHRLAEMSALLLQLGEITDAITKWNLKEMTAKEALQRIYDLLDAVKPKDDTCENYIDGEGVHSRFCSTFEGNAQVHAPTCQFFKKRKEGS